jgi:hypothetical protein
VGELERRRGAESDDEPLETEYFARLDQLARRAERVGPHPILADVQRRTAPLDRWLSELGITAAEAEERGLRPPPGMEHWLGLAALGERVAEDTARMRAEHEAREAARRARSAEPSTNGHNRAH